MLRNQGEGGSRLYYWPPRSRSLKEQVELLERIGIARVSYPGKPRLTWDEIAKQEGIPKRTLQHFYRSSLKGPRVCAYYRRTRSRRAQAAKALRGAA